MLPLLHTGGKRLQNTANPMRVLLLFGFLIAGSAAWAQLETDADFRRTVYEEEYTVGISLHTRSPWPGLQFRRVSYTDGFTKWGYEIAHTVYRHPQEVRFPIQSLFGSSRSLTYGKVNSFFALRGGYGREKVLFDKTDQGTVSIHLNTYGGVALGFLKPVYIYIEERLDNGSVLTHEVRYNPDIHDSNIFGRAPYFKGFGEIQPRMGLYFETGVSFDYNFLDEKITALEVGGIVDYYPSWFGLYPEGGVPIMAHTNNLSLWWQIYVRFSFGNKWY